MEGKALGPSPLRESAISPPQADHVLVDLFFIRGRPGCCVKGPRQWTKQNGWGRRSGGGDIETTVLEEQ